MPLLDGRPPAVDNRFRPGNPYTCTFQWPAGSLTGRTFTAALDAAALTVNIVGNNMVVSMTPAQTTAAANVGEFKLTETTGGVNDVVIIGSWHSSTGPSAGEATTVTVNESAGVVTVTAQGVAPIVGTLTVTGALTVPNPAPPATPNAAVSIGEVEDLIGMSPAGFLRAMGSRTTLANVSNTTTETSLLQAAKSMPKPIEDAVWRVTAFGVVGNNSGGNATFTFRLKNLTDAVTLTTLAVTLATDTATGRAFKLEVVGEGNTFIGAGNMNVGELAVAPGNTDTLKQIMSQNATAGPGTDPQNWDLTVQMSVANANTSTSMYGVQVAYSIPGL